MKLGIVTDSTSDLPQHIIDEHGIEVVPAVLVLDGKSYADGKGISREGELIDMAVEAGIVQKSGTWFSFGDERLGQGRETAKQVLTDNADIRAEVERKVRETKGMKFANEEAGGAKDSSS